jgi:UDP-N-acetylglucosamine 3-dehydrogenase
MDEIQLAVIGTGLIGSLYSHIIAQTYGAKLVAVCDVISERVGALAEELKVRPYVGSQYAHIFADFPDLYGVLVCTSEINHVEPALAALQAGKHLFVEKPLAESAGSAQRIVSGAQGCTQVTMVGYSLRFDPRYYLMQQAVLKGEIGEIVQIYARRTPSLATLERIQARVELPFWVGVHDLDMMRWVTGSDIREVYARCTWMEFGGKRVKSAIISNIQFKNGVIAVLENAWRTASTSSRQQSTAYFKVQGTRGEIEVKSHEQGITITREGEMYVPDTVYMPQLHDKITGVYRDQIDHFISCIRYNRLSSIPLEDGLAGVKAAEAILQSIEAGGAVILPE